MRPSLDQIGTLAERAPLFAGESWQMSYGERAALEGMICQLKPKLAIEVGSAGGASLQTLARHCAEVHSFDLVTPSEEAAGLDNVTLHTGNSHELLPAVLDEFESAGRTVDFAFVDGDHTADGVRRDIEDLLDSGAFGEGMILAHDAANGVVRKGLREVDFAARAQVAYVDLDFIGGYVFRKQPYAGEIWGGLALIVAGPPRSTVYVEGRAPTQDARHSTFELLSLGWRERARVDGALAKLGGAADHLSAIELEHLVAREHAEVERLTRLLDEITGSSSWRLTEPIRRLARRLRPG